MSDDEAPQSHWHLRDIGERISEHHRHTEQDREEEELSEAADEAGFDLGADLAHPTPRPAAESYDIDADLGYGAT